VQFRPLRRLNNSTTFAAFVCSGCRTAGTDDSGGLILRISARTDVPVGDALHICWVRALGWTVEEILLETKAVFAPGDATIVE
jgi:hypothetical protein